MTNSEDPYQWLLHLRKVARPNKLMDVAAVTEVIAKEAEMRRAVPNAGIFLLKVYQDCGAQHNYSQVV